MKSRFTTQVAKRVEVLLADRLELVHQRCKRLVLVVSDFELVSRWLVELESSASHLISDPASRESAVRGPLDV